MITSTMTKIDEDFFHIVFDLFSPTFLAGATALLTLNDEEN